MTFKQTEAPFHWTIIVALVIISIVGICTGQNQSDKVHLLRSDSLAINQGSRQSRLDFLLDVVEHQHDVQVQLVLANEDNRTQARVIFATAFAAFATLVFTQKKRYQPTLTMVALAFTAMFYLLDIHLRDLSERQIQVRNELHNTIVAISEVPADDLHWYQIDQARIDSLFSQSYEHRVARKGNPRVRAES